MKGRFAYYFIPVFIIIYFAISFYPIIRMTNAEVIPFFSFKLYSKIPNGFERYDVAFNLGEKDEHFLLYQNTHLNGLQWRRYAAELRQITNAYENNMTVKLDKLEDAFPKNQTATLVRFKGDYIEAVRDRKYQLEVVEQLR
ncbi:hypothetical protein FNH22_28185 [Fulvivirga sp. M361]|uniref:hypothetical protein n=1 Tax=Fulvivirga sp. M361 TaxID=2594266 RepID=UPI0011799431|nr:hypothetical protein [Fulvivirga sp. M361]TRX48918.1 hypothetical protein FNH22_28185 [Fulvivirga sp. M361]